MAQAVQKKREEGEKEQLRQAKEKKIADDQKQLGKQKELEHKKAQVHNAFVNGLQVDKAKKHAKFVARMKALQTGKKKKRFESFKRRTP